MNRKTRWTALCGCISIFEWNESVPETERTHVITAFDKQCPQHADLEPGPGALETIRDDTAHLAEDATA